MGILRSLRLVDVPPGVDATTPKPQIASPWTDRSALETIVWADLFGLETVPPSRAEALSIPSVWRARNIVCSTIARSPLVVYRVEVPLVDQPGWTQRTDGLSSPFARMVASVDDLIFHGECLWLVERGADEMPTRAERVPYADWSVTEDRKIQIRDRDVPAGAAVYIPGPHEGILTYGGRAIRSAALLERWRWTPPAPRSSWSCTRPPTPPRLTPRSTN